MRGPVRRAFTIVELLVVVAIVGTLTALLLPAVQVAREAARRAHCAINLKQLGLAVQTYLDSQKLFPTGNVWFFSSPTIRSAQGAAWSALLLPQLEEQAIYDTLSFTEGGQGNWGQIAPGNPKYPTRNQKACETVVSVFRCPSAVGDTHLYNVSEGDGWVTFKRVPANYIACASGRVTHQYLDSHAPNLLRADGVIHNDSRVAPRQVSDGLTATMLIGEALPDYFVTATNQREPAGTKDHWYIGGDDPDTQSGSRNFDPSEFLGSTGVPIQAQKGDEGYELSFSSAHRGGIHAVFCDGSTRLIGENIDLTIWNAMGTRAGCELVR